MNRSVDTESNGDINHVSYSDPLGPPEARPKTGMRVTLEEDSDDDLNAADLLPM